MKEFFKRMGCGAAIGVAVIIPGVSGGTLAVLLNIYDKLINAVSDLRRDFKNSVIFLLPILLGAGLAVAAAYFPIKFFLSKAPLPTVLLFTGLMLGSFPKLLKDGISCGFKKPNIASIIIPLAAVVGICFIPAFGEADLSVNMNAGGYFILILVGAAASCALVVPGISGSMLLLILGYYKPILNTVSALKTTFGHAALVLLAFALGIIFGFFTIAKLMKLLFKLYPRGTRWAIIGFVIGSIPAILITFPSNFAENFPIPVVHIVIGVILCIAGGIATFALTTFVEAKTKKAAESLEEPAGEQAELSAESSKTADEKTALTADSTEPADGNLVAPESKYEEPKGEKSENENLRGSGNNNGDE